MHCHRYTVAANRLDTLSQPNWHRIIIQLWSDYGRSLHSDGILKKNWISAPGLARVPVQYISRRMTPTLHPNAKRWLHPNWKKILKTDLASPLFGRLPYGLAIDMHSPREVREELVRICFYWEQFSSRPGAKFHKTATIDMRVQTQKLTVLPPDGLSCALFSGACC